MLNCTKMKNNLKLFSILLSFFLIIVINGTLKSQENRNLKMQKRFVAGSGFGLQFGTITVVGLSPEIGYKITKNLVSGLGFSFQYYKDSRYLPVYKSNIYGGSVFSRYYLYKDFFAHAEYQVLKYDYLDWNTGIDKEVTTNAILVGGGYRQWLGRNVFSKITVLFNINESLYYPYSSPIFRAGVYFLF